MYISIYSIYSNLICSWILQANGELREHGCMIGEWDYNDYNGRIMGYLAKTGDQWRLRYAHVVFHPVVYGISHELETYSPVLWSSFSDDPPGVSRWMAFDSELYRMKWHTPASSWRSRAGAGRSWWDISGANTRDGTVFGDDLCAVTQQCSYIREAMCLAPEARTASKVVATCCS